MLQHGLDRGAWDVGIYSLSPGNSHFAPCHPLTPMPTSPPPPHTQGLAPHENVIEVVVAEANLTPAAASGLLAPDTCTFAAWDFYLHDSQATPLLPGPSPAYDTTVRYIVEQDGFLLDYLSGQVLLLEVFEARGWEVRGLGVARLSLRAVLEGLRATAGEHEQGVSLVLLMLLLAVLVAVFCGGASWLTMTL